MQGLVIAVVVLGCQVVIIVLPSSALAADIRWSHRIELDGRYNARTVSRILHTGIEGGDVTTARLSVDSQLQSRWATGIRFKGQLKGFYDIGYDLRSSPHVADDRDAYGNELEIGEFYFTLPFNTALQFAVGRQINAWGYLDFLRVVDIVNPLDLREPGLIDLEDSRLPLLLSQVDILLGRWRFNGALIHEFRRDETVPFGSDYYNLPTRIPAPTGDNKDAVLADNPGTALRLNYQLPRGDLAFYRSRARRADGRVSDPLVNPQTVHEFEKQTGLALQIQWDNWVFKSEASFIQDRIYTANGVNRVVSDLTTLGLGLEYQGWNDILLSLEVLNRRIHDFETGMAGLPDLALEDDRQLIAYGQWDMVPDIWQVNNLYFWSRDRGYFNRLILSYNLSDYFTLSAGWINYGNGSHLLAQNLDRNDQVFMKMAWNF